MNTEDMDAKDNESMSAMIKDCIRAYKPMLAGLSLAAKAEVRQKIIDSGANATDEMLSLACAITADPEFTQWIRGRGDLGGAIFPGHTSIVGGVSPENRGAGGARPTTST